MSNVNTRSEKTKRLVGVAIFAAIIIALQAFATAVNFVTPGTIPIALVLPPLVIGAAIYGAKVGMMLGICFGAVVMFSGIFGLAPTSAMMWNTSPIIFVVGTLGRGAAVGFVAGYSYKLFAKKDAFVGVWAASIVAPIVNTALFTIVFFLFLEVLVDTGDGYGLLHYASAFMISFNFMLEMVVNIVIAPAIARIINVGKKMR